ncbi:hypothetical protein PHMEG_00012977 [Phytophthora megakarya]|uniref:Uncharacterized protein n=1 Tax=Phytophthora megakarya TaxID=4795 RepID=A0A225W7E1_9STRA|nr:hypothetical protein PHMEG_00012977 [Phytophthora megakarya]
MRYLVEIISQLLTDSDLDLFNDRWSGEPIMLHITDAMHSVGRRYCPVGTREALHEEGKNLRKTRHMTVEESDAQFQHLKRLECFLPPRDGASLTGEDLCHHSSAGIPRAWQLSVVSQHARWRDFVILKVHYIQIERVEQQVTKETNGKGTAKPNQNLHLDGRKGKKKQNKGGQQGEEKRRKLNPQEGCKFCRAKGNVWNNRGDGACFRNTKSPSYRPCNGETMSRTPRPNHRVHVSLDSNKPQQ